MSDTLHVLWTGGWDSTYRVLDLMVHASPITIQPHYVLNPKRLSHRFELSAIERIRERAIQRWGNRLLTPRTIDVDKIPISDTARQQHAELVQRFHIGPQYLWLAEYARSTGIDRMELCIHVDDKAYGVIAALRESEHCAAGTHDTNAADLIRERFSFPILRLTKQQMRDKARASGFEDLMDLTWFCQIPTRDDTPCGFCNPCQWTMEEGLAYRIPRKRRIRLAIYRGLVEKLPSYRVRHALLTLLRR